MSSGPPKKIAAGFSTDLNMLLDRFSATGTVRYGAFAKLWRDAKFPLIFCGRKDPRELRLFIEEVFHIILQLWVPTSSFQERVFALYMLYGMYQMQPMTPKIKIRIKMNHWAMSEDILQMSAKEQHLDICYVIHRMRVEHSFHFVAFLKLRSPAILGQQEDDRTTVSELSSRVYFNLRNLMSGGPMEQLRLIHEEYKSLRAVQDDPFVSQLDIVSDNIFEDFQRDAAKLQAKYKAQPQQQEGDASSDPDEESDVDLDTSNVGARRKRLREKQFARASQTRKGQRYEQLRGDVTDEGTDVDSSPKAMGKKKRRSKKGERAKAKSTKAGNATSRQTKTKKTAAASNGTLARSSVGTVKDFLTEVKAVVEEKVRENVEAFPKPAQGRPRKNAKSSEGNAGETGTSGADEATVSENVEESGEASRKQAPRRPRKSARSSGGEAETRVLRAVETAVRGNVEEDEGSQKQAPRRTRKSAKSSKGEAGETRTPSADEAATQENVEESRRAPQKRRPKKPVQCSEEEAGETRTPSANEAAVRENVEGSGKAPRKQPPRGLRKSAKPSEGETDETRTASADAAAVGGNVEGGGKAPQKRAPQRRKESVKSSQAEIEETRTLAADEAVVREDVKEHGEASQRQAPRRRRKTLQSSEGETGTLTAYDAAVKVEECGEASKK